MNKNTATLFALLVLFYINSFAQKGEADIIIGTNYTIQSKYLDQDRSIQVYLPDSYNESNQNYPVLYVLDGQWYFVNGVAIQKALRTPSHLPEMIVVGIHNENPLRRTLFDDQKDKFLLFMEHELIDFVDTTFRTSDQRILFGWEAAGYFTSEVIFDSSDLFDGAIISDGATASEKILNDFINSHKTNEKYVFIANSDKDIFYYQDGAEFSNLLAEKAPSHVNWKYQLFNNEVHVSLPYLALYHGLLHFYHNFPSLIFRNIKEFNDLGGVPYLEVYFKERSERFGFPPGIDDSTKNGLIWLAWNRDDYDSFHFFMLEFEDVLSTKRYASAYWQNRFAQFYLKHGDHDNAILYFNKGIDKYPDAAFMTIMYEGLGDAYMAKKEREQALKAYKSALKIDSDLEAVQVKIKDIKNN